MAQHIVIVGAGQAGFSAAAKLRQLGYDGRLTMIGEEADPPYARPPLSKKYLMGEMDRARLYLRPESFYAAQDINWIGATRVTGIDRAAKQVTHQGGTLPFDQLILATGAKARTLPAAIGGDLPGVFTMRSLADADRLAPHFQTGKHVLIVGGGYIGLEAAAVAAQTGMQVTLIEMADRILERVAARETSDFFRNLHRQHGVRILERTGLDRLTGGDHVGGAVLSDGQKLIVDQVIVGIGVQPNMELARQAGLATADGISVNALGQTSDPTIWAAGDCASFPHGDASIRLESVPNAIEHAETVAENIMGAAKSYVPKIWFWSDQYDVKLQIAGLNAGYSDVVTRPPSKPGAASHWYFDGPKLIALDAMNDPRAYVIGKRLIEAGLSPDRAAIADRKTDLKSLLHQRHGSPLGTA